MLQFTVKKCSKMNILQNNWFVTGKTEKADCLEAFKKRNALTKMIKWVKLYSRRSKLKKTPSRGISTFTMVYSVWTIVYGWEIHAVVPFLLRKSV